MSYLVATWKMWQSWHGKGEVYGGLGWRVVFTFFLFSFFPLEK